jgi:hypothetical protein
MEFVPTKFVEEYVEKYPQPLTEIGEFVFYRTYSRWLEERGRREYWHETVKRAIEYNMALELKHQERIGRNVDFVKMRQEAKSLFKNVYHTKQFPSGRSLWIGNANEKVNKNFVLGNFNCFARDTEFITDKGIKSFQDFDNGDKVNVINKSGKWAEATVRNFGADEIYELTVRNGKRVETIKTTSNHRWYVRNISVSNAFEIVPTSNLEQGQSLHTPESRVNWKVESVKATGKREEVWCVQEPETESFTLANGILTKNCAFSNIEKWGDMKEIFYLLMVGTGIGVKATQETIQDLPPVRADVNLIHAPYEPVLPKHRLEHTKVSVLENGYAKIYIGDSKEGE